jgi:hypothetical protein
MKLGETFLRKWAPRVGPIAARWKWRNVIARMVAALANPIWFVAIVIGARTSNALIIAFGVSVAVVAGVAVVASVISLRAYLRAATKALGVKVGYGNSPPKADRSYEGWCRLNGVVPYKLQDGQRINETLP